MLAKEPAPGRSKTRLCPPLRPHEAAQVAEAALVTTLDAVAATRTRRPTLVLDGDTGSWLPRGFHVTPQDGDGQAERIANAFAGAGGPALLIGMDSPQVTADLLDEAVAALGTPGVDAVLGPAEDGGYWAVGLKRADPRVFAGVPMSRSDTGRIQLERLMDLGLRTRLLPVLRDVDRFEDALAVALRAPGTPFADTMERLSGARQAISG